MISERFDSVARDPSSDVVHQVMNLISLSAVVEESWSVQASLR